MADEILLERQVPGVRLHPRGDGVVGHGQDLGVDAEATTDLVDDVCEACALAQPVRAQDVQRRVGVTEPEPHRLPERLHRAHQRPRLVPSTPPLLPVLEVAERVEGGIEIRADPQLQQVEVVAGVDDHPQRAGRQAPVQAQRELGAADPA